MDKRDESGQHVCDYCMKWYDTLPFTSVTSKNASVASSVSKPSSVEAGAVKSLSLMIWDCLPGHQCQLLD